MTLSLHKLWAGSGYEYLTRQVARLDATHGGGSPLASYYAERGETPGVWVGSGLAGVEGVSMGGPVDAAEMRSLFGEGRHPLAGRLVDAARTAGASERDALRAGNLGAPYRARSATQTPFEAEVRRRLASLPRPRDVVVSEVAREWFTREHGRAPRDARELAGTVARHGSQGQPVAGYDLTFSPVKSVSALWALAAPDVAAEVERCHRAAVADALAFVESRVLFTREGARGVRQVEVRGLVAAAFTHRDSRAGDPDLHTHVAVANKVQTHQGKWLAIDGRVLYAATTAASETYNTALEAHLTQRLGVRFVPRILTTGPTPHAMDARGFGGNEARLNGGNEPGAPARTGKRAVRELVGVDERLLLGWSSRRARIDERRSELARDFQARAGRPPDRREAWALAQQATLDTRPAKHEPRTLSEQRSAWAAQAADLLGSTQAVARMLGTVLHPAVRPASVMDAATVARAAELVVATIEAERATWGAWHLNAEAQRRVRPLDVPPGMAGHVVDLVVAEAENRCVPLTPPTGPSVPDALRRTDGTSVYDTVGSRRWTSRRVLDAERQLLDAAGQTGGRRVDPATVEVAIVKAGLDGPTLNAGQAELVRSLAGSGRRLQLALAPAGTGKTTALRVLAQAWTAAGGCVVGLAPSAAAAAVLADQLTTNPAAELDGHSGVPTDTLAKLIWTLDHPAAADTRSRPGWFDQLGPGSLVLIDEAGLADSPSLARAVGYILGVGGSVRLIGDDRQLGAVGAGGLLRDLAEQHGAARLDEVVRFTDPAEAAASLGLRDGRPEALGFYLDHRRVHVGDQTTAADQLFTAWTDDRIAGLDTLMLAPTRTLVADLNRRARNHRLSYQHGGAGPTPGPGAPLAAGLEVVLADENEASWGDVVITRTNHRGLTPRTTRSPATPGSPVMRRGLRTDGWVRNGDRWTVDRVHDDGSLDVTALNGRRAVTLPATYVAASVELGYAITIHAAQGTTCDTVHGLLDGRETRAQLYTLLTRGRTANHAYLQLDPDHTAGQTDLHPDSPDNPSDPTSPNGPTGTAHPGHPAALLGGPDQTPTRSATQILGAILGREADDARSATRHQADLHDPALRLPDAADTYLDSLHAAAEHTTPPDLDQALVDTAERLLPGLTDEPAWPTLRSQLLLDQAHGHDPQHALTLAVATTTATSPPRGAPPHPGGIPSGPVPSREVRDRAAVLHRQIRRLHPAAGGPLPWLPSVPDRLLDHPTWGAYLTAQDRLVRSLANQTSERAAASPPSWARHLPGDVSRDLFGDVAVWRAVHRTPTQTPAHSDHPAPAAPTTPANAFPTTSRHTPTPAPQATTSLGTSPRTQPRRTRSETN